VHSSITEGEFIEAAYLFRNVHELPELEQVALAACKGHVLDAGAGAGSHALVLQEKGHPVTAIDVSPLAVQLMQERGVKDARCINFFALPGDPTFDTILLLMNGIGIAGTLEGLDQFLAQAKTLLKPTGQILLDSTDILYIFEEEDGSIWIDLNAGYHGEVTYQMEYKEALGESFDWLFVGYEVLEDHAERAGYACERMFLDENDQYLARLVPRQ
jgi:SAM-dependent methyltransferase